MEKFRVGNYNVMHSLVSEVSTQLSNDRRDDARERIETHPHNNYEILHDEIFNIEKDLSPLHWRCVRP